jgi:hypothetical protein
MTKVPASTKAAQRFSCPLSTTSHSCRGVAKSRVDRARFHRAFGSDREVANGATFALDVPRCVSVVCCYSSRSLPLGATPSLATTIRSWILGTAAPVRPTRIRRRRRHRRHPSAGMTRTAKLPSTPERARRILRPAMPAELRRPLFTIAPERRSRVAPHVQDIRRCARHLERASRNAVRIVRVCVSHAFNVSAGTNPSSERARSKTTLVTV